MQLDLSDNSKEFISFLKKKYKLSESEIVNNLIMVSHVAYLQNSHLLSKQINLNKKSANKEVGKKLKDKRNMNVFDYHSKHNNFPGHINNEEGC